MITDRLFAPRPAATKIINLLDDASKREIRAARLNVTLLTYCVIVVFAVVSVALLALFSYWWLGNRTASAQAQQTDNESRTSQYASTKAEAAAFSANLGKIQSVLSQRSHYSAALLNIAASLPDGAYIGSVTLAPTFVTTPLAISATTADYAGALALKANLSKSPIYSSVTLDSANCNVPSTGSDGKVTVKSGCDVSLTAKLKADVFTVGATE